MTNKILLKLINNVPYLLAVSKRFDLEILVAVAVFVEEQPVQCIGQAGFTCAVCAGDRNAFGSGLKAKILDPLEVLQREPQ